EQIEQRPPSLIASGNARRVNRRRAPLLRRRQHVDRHVGHFQLAHFKRAEIAELDRAAVTQEQIVTGRQGHLHKRVAPRRQHFAAEGNQQRLGRRRTNQTHCLAGLHGRAVVDQNPRQLGEWRVVGGEWSGGGAWEWWGGSIVRWVLVQHGSFLQ